MKLSYIMNGQAHGTVAGKLLRSQFDPGVLRPYVEVVNGQERSFVTIANGYDPKGKPKYKAVEVANEQASLLRDEWKLIDRTVQEAAMPRLRAWQDLVESSRLVIPQGMGKTVVESSRIKDITPAKVSMNGVAQSDNDVPEGDTVGIPLPIIHKDFKFSLRELEVSRNGSIPLDTTVAGMAARKVAEEVEKLTVGIGAGQGYNFGGYKIYGYASFPERLTYEMSDPEAGGYAASTLITELIAMRKSAEDVGFYGPFVLYVSSDWSAFMDNDYSSVKGTNTVRQRVLAMEGISRIVTLDYLTGFQMLMVQLTPDVARAIIGMPLTTLQWEQKGGMEVCMKVMAIMVPQLRADFYNGTGIVHGIVPGST